MPRARHTLPATLVAVLLLVGIVGVQPASAAPKPRLPIALTTKPANPSGTNTAAFAWTTVATVSYTCVLDGVSSSCPGGTKTYTGLADGPHNFSVSGKKPGSFRPGSAVYSWVVDTTPPAAPTISPIASPTSTTSASVSFTDSDPTATVFTCKLDGAAAVPCTSAWAIPGPLAEGSHTVAVQSQDSHGVLGGTSSVTWVVDLTAPANVQLVGPLTPYANATDFTFSATGATVFTCSLDGTAATACTSPLHLAGLADGPHTLIVDASDGAGNAAQPASAIWTVDTTAPQAPTLVSGPAAQTNQTTADLVLGNLDGSSSLQCRLDSALSTDWVPCPNPLHWSGLSEASHTINVRAVDAAGNVSLSVTASWTVDTTAPAPALFTGGPNSPSNDTDPVFSFVNTDLSASGFLCAYTVNAVTPPVQGAYVICDVDALPFTGPLTDGDYKLYVESVDSSGNINSSPVVWAWTIDTTAPGDVALTGPVPAYAASTSFTFSSTGASTFTCALDGAAAAGCTSPLSLSGLAEGAHTLVVTAADAADNAATPASVTWTVDTTAPGDVALTGPLTPNAASTSFTFSSTGASTFTCALDGAAATGCTSPLSLSGLSEGSHTLVVTAADAADNAAQPASVTWTVDTTPPGDVALTGPLTPNSAATDFTFSSAGAVSFTCTLDTAAPAACTSPLHLSGLSLGSHTLVVTAADAADNAAQPASATWAITAPVVTPPVVTPPATAATTTATLAAARALVGRSTASFSANVHGLSTATVRLVSATGVVSPETLACANAGGAVVACTSGAVRAVAVVPTKALTPGQQYTFSVQGTDALGRTVAGSQAFRASTDEQESSPAAVYGWAKVKSTKALGHSYFVESGKGATVTVAFTGRTVTWLTTTGPTQGLAKVYVDGVRKAKVNNWSAATHWQVARTIKGLKAGNHRLKVVVVGRKGNTKGTGTDVVMDGIKVGKKLGRNAPVFTWQHVSAATASAGGYAVSAKKGATASFTFRGTSLSWVSAKGPTMGKAKVYVDGVLKGTVDNYAKRAGSGLKRTYAGLADKVHTVKVVATGTKRTTSKGTSVVVDRWLVG